MNLASSRAKTWLRRHFTRSGRSLPVVFYGIVPHRFQAEGGDMESRVREPVSDHHIGQRHLDCLVMLSDGVFAIAITLSAIEIKSEAVPGRNLWPT